MLDCCVGSTEGLGISATDGPGPPPNRRQLSDTAAMCARTVVQEEAQRFSKHKRRKTEQPRENKRKQKPKH
jgi:hypothetical protein